MYANLYTDYFTKFSGKWNNSDNTGTFYINVNYSTSNSNSNLSAHLMFFIVKT